MTKKSHQKFLRGKQNSMYRLSLVRGLTAFMFCAVINSA